MRVAAYLGTRFTTLIPTLTVPENPISLLRTLNRQQVSFFCVAFFALTCDSLDYNCVTLNITRIAQTYNKSKSDVTWAITMTLMLRCIGAVLFGIAGDRFGRKWPFVINVFLVAIIEICTGFCQTYEQFIAIRALFGIAMGGINGIAAATALEDAPLSTRGLLSGVFQQGYPLGYLLAAAFNLAITDHQLHGWRALFWFGGCPPLLIALWRIFLPETQAFIHAKKARTSAGETNHQVSEVRTFLGEARSVLSQHWLTLIYLVLMMAAFNFLSHGSDDLYPTFLDSQLKLSNNLVTVIIVVGNCGGIVGGILSGYFSSLFGRRLTIIVVLIVGAALIPTFLFPRDSTIMAGAFFELLCVHGVWGIVPIHLLELSPPQFRSFVIGTSYQLGNLIAAPSSTIEASAAENFPLQTSSHSFGGQRYDYAKIIAIFLASVYACLLIIIVLGPEKRNVEQTEIINGDDKTDNELRSTTSPKPRHDEATLRD